MSKTKETHEIDDPNQGGPIYSVRFLISLLLIAAGIVYVVLWTLYVRDARGGSDADSLIPGMAKLDDWNWLIGFGLIFVGLGAAAHPTTPLGRGRGVIVGMLGCFLIGLIWICTFYVFADRPQGQIWLLGDLGDLNLIVGIGFMAVGFTYATRWE